MSERITLEKCWIEYEYRNGKVTPLYYAGEPDEVIRELLERHLLPRKRFLENPYHPNHPWWGKDPL